MTDSDKDSGNQPKQWSPEDRRSLVITFVGGLTSIIVGAGVLGLAAALARYVNHSNNVSTWIWLVAFPVINLISVVFIVRHVKESRLYLIPLSISGSLVVVVILTWIGVAAGIK